MTPSNIRRLDSINNSIDNNYLAPNSMWELRVNGIDLERFVDLARLAPWSS